MRNHRYRVDDQRIAFPVPDGVTPGLRPQRVARRMAAAVGVDVPNLASGENKDRLLGCDQNLESPRRLHHAWEIEAALIPALVVLGWALLSRDLRLPLGIVRSRPTHDPILERRPGVA